MGRARRRLDKRERQRGEGAIIIRQGKGGEGRGRSPCPLLSCSCSLLSQPPPFPGELCARPHLFRPPALGGLAGRPSRRPARAFRGAVFEWGGGVAGRACVFVSERGGAGVFFLELGSFFLSLSPPRSRAASLTRSRAAGAGAPPAAPPRSSSRSKQAWERIRGAPAAEAFRAGLFFRWVFKSFLCLGWLGWSTSGESGVVLLWLRVLE